MSRDHYHSGDWEGALASSLFALLLVGLLIAAYITVQLTLLIIRLFVQHPVKLNEDVIRKHPQQRIFFNLFAENWHRCQAVQPSSTEDSQLSN